jgi:thimet oligopeptidase
MGTQLPRYLIITALVIGSVSMLPGLAPQAEAILQADTTPEALTKQVEERLASAQEILDQVKGVEGPRTVENTFVPLNDMSIELDAAWHLASFAENIHPSPEVRAAGEKASQECNSFFTALSLDRDVYDAVAAVDVSGSDPATQRLYEHMMRDFRRSGVDKDEATREKIKLLREELIEIGQEFDRNIREGKRTIELDSAEELAGLPEDYIASHQPGENGKIVITTEYPDVFPIFSYAKNPEVRRRLYMEFTNRAYPENREVLLRLITKRDELAKTLGYDNWAAYITEDKMAESPKNVEEFIAKLDEAAEVRGKRDYAMLLESKKKDDPAATEILDWERRYYSEQVKSDNFAFDSQELRPYYNYPAVKQGILDLSSQLFDVTFKHIPDATVWNPAIDYYEVYENGEMIGSFYLDMHPRDGKFGHAAQFTLVTGVKGKQLPIAALVCNFPEPDENGLALMEHGQVETFLHEFGHLLHEIFSGDQTWVDQSGTVSEWDFVEAPSQLLEEWALDPATLQTFAKHYETGEPIPAELIAKLRASQDFGNGLRVQQQNFYTAVSLNCYNQDPENIDPDKMVPELQAKYSPFPFVEGSHMYANFGHLEGYSAMYYTYMWSLVIAKDLFSKFNKDNLLDPTVAVEYRHKILDPGGTIDAADMVEEFLGRPYGFESFRVWLEGSPAN